MNNDLCCMELADSDCLPNSDIFKISYFYESFFSFLRWGETESTW
jgi:hypothetical protein